MKRELNKAAKKRKASYWKLIACCFVFGIASSEFKNFKEKVTAEDCVQEKVELAWNKRSVVFPVKCKADNSLKTALNEQKLDLKYKR